MWDIITALKTLTGHLEKAGVESPRLVSEILLAHLLGIRRIDIYSKFDEPVPEDKLKEINPLVAELKRGVPLQLVVGGTQFLSYNIRTARGVFIPRPETEVLVDTTVQMMKSAGLDSAPRIIDIGAGTGVVALSLLKQFPGATAHVIDINPAAITLAIDNAEALGVADRLTAHNGSLFAPVANLEGEFDIVISNPPYIPTGDLAGLEPIVRDHDPREALDGGADGFDTTKNIITEAPRFMKEGGLLALEIGIGQAARTAELMEQAGLTGTRIEKDLSGIERCVFAWKRG